MTVSRFNTYSPTLLSGLGSPFPWSLHTLTNPPLLLSLSTAQSLALPMPFLYFLFIFYAPLGSIFCYLTLSLWSGFVPGLSVLIKTCYLTTLDLSSRIWVLSSYKNVTDSLFHPKRDQTTLNSLLSVATNANST